MGQRNKVKLTNVHKDISCYPLQTHVMRHLYVLSPTVCYNVYQCMLIYKHIHTKNMSLALNQVVLKVIFIFYLLYLRMSNSRVMFILFNMFKGLIVKKQKQRKTTIKHPHHFLGDIRLSKYHSH